MLWVYTDPVSSSGQRILQGRYEILRVLGRGGGGAVYLCQDLRVTGRLWAVKELDSCGQPEAAVRQFEQEAALLSGLRHANLPLVADFFSEDGRHYLVMEFVEGQNLDLWVAENGPVDPTRALTWALTLCRVLDYLHSQTPPVVFRDLKPANIMLTARGTLKLIDFGLALRSESPEHSARPQGSVGYAAPEQWEGEGGLDPRVDIYGLGATLTYLLSGRHPSPVVGNQTWQPPAGLSPAFRNIIWGCLKADPQERYASAEEVAEALERILARPPARGRRLALGLAALVPLLVLTLGWPGRQDLPAERLTPLPHTDLTIWRRALEDGRSQEGLAGLRAVLEREPHNVEAQLLQQNAQALATGLPLWRIPVLLGVYDAFDSTGQSMLRGMVLAQQDVNQPGAPQLVLDLYDNGPRRERVLDQAQQIIRDGRYLAGLGPHNTQDTLLTAPLFNSAGLSMVTPSASDPRLWEAGRYIFVASDSSLARVGSIARWLVKKGYHRVVVAGEDEMRLQTSITRFFLHELTTAGGQLVGGARYRSAQEDYQSVVQNAEQGRPDFVYVADYRGRVAAQVARVLRRQGHRQTLGSQAVAFDPDLLKQGGRDIDGIILASYFNPFDPQAPVAGFRRRCQARFGLDLPTHLEATAYDATRLVVEGLKVCHSREEMRAYLESIGQGRPLYKGITGPFAVSRRLDLRPVHLVTVRNSAYRLLDD